MKWQDLTLFTTCTIVHVMFLCISGFATRVLNEGPTPRQGRKTDNAHPPIHPTRYTSGLSVSSVSITTCTCTWIINRVMSKESMILLSAIFSLVVQKTLKDKRLP